MKKQLLYAVNIRNNTHYSRNLLKTILYASLVFFNILVSAQTRTVYLGNGTSWTAPAGITSISVQCWGGGGGGGGAYNTSLFGGNVSGSGGGGGGYTSKTFTVVPGTSYNYVVGLGGAGGTGGGNGAKGGNTTFTVAGVTITANGGGGGGGKKASGGNAGSTGGAGGTGVGGTVNYSGGNGAGATGNQSPGGGGGGAGSSANGAAGTTTVGGAGGSGNYYGKGGTPPTTDEAGYYGNLYGGGGSGARSGFWSSNNSGGGGASGIVIISYCTVPVVADLTNQTICKGSSVNLTASATPNTIVFSENFESYENDFIYGGWYEYATSDALYGNSAYEFSAKTPAGGSRCLSLYDITNDVENGYDKTVAENLVAYTAINAKSFSGLKLNFKWKGVGETNYDYGNVTYSLDGTTWTDLPTKYQGQSAWQTVSNLALPASLDGKNFYLGFRWRNDDSNGSNPPFTIDDITITGTQSFTYAWTPGTGLNVTNTATVTASPTTTTTYTVAVSNGDCATNKSVTVNVNPAPAVSNMTAVTCTGIAFSVIPVDGANGTVPAGTTYSWSAPTVSGGMTGGAAGSDQSSISGTLANTTTTAQTATYTVTPKTNSCTGASFTVTVTVNADNTAGTASSNPTVCINAAMPNVTVSTTGATGIGTATGLPNGVEANWSSNTITISGTPTKAGTFNYSIPLTGGCGNVTATGTITVEQNITYANLQHPGSVVLCEKGSFTAYGQVYKAGVTDSQGQGAGITVEFGYSTSNSNPNTWTNWSPATFNTDSWGNSNDEYKYVFSPQTAGTYYYTFRYRSGSCDWVYGGYSTTGGGFWDGTTNKSGVATVESPVNAGTITPSSTSVCNGSATTLTVSGYSGNLQWQTSSDNTNFQNISGATSAAYTAPNLTSTTYYRVIATNSCGTATGTSVMVTVDQPIGWANLQHPQSGSSCAGSTFTAYGQVYKQGVTEAAGPGAGIIVQFGYHTVDTNPNTWTNWAPAVFNTQSNNNDEYKYDFIPPANTTYYYTFRYKSGNCDWVYGGYNSGFWDGTTNKNGVLKVGETTVYSATGWSIPPNPNLSAQITADYSTSNGGLAVCTFSVNNGAKAVITVNNPLKVQNEITIDAGSSLTVESDANLIQVNDNAVNTGNITVKRNINVSAARKQYNYLISPVVDGNLKTNIYNGNISSPSVQYYTESNNRFGESSGNYIPGRALAVKEPATGTGPFAAIFVGKPANGVISYAAVNSAPAVTADGPALRGYNLIGNPYPSNMDLRQFYTNNGGVAAGVSATFQFWDNNGNTTYSQNGSNYSGNAYATYNAIDNTGVKANADAGSSNKVPTQYVKVAQGFITRVTVANKTLQFQNAIRTDKAGENFFGKEVSENKDRFWLNLISPANIAANMAVVYFAEGTNGFAADDSRHMGGSDALYSLVDGEKVSINGKNTFADSDIVALGSRQFAEGNYTIALDKAEGVFANGQNIFLKDKQTGIITNLSQGNYTFSTGAGEFTGRFEIIYKPGTVLATDGNATEQLQVYRDGNSFVVKSQTKKITLLEVFDTSGRLIYSLTPNNAKANVNAENISNGTYVLKIHRGTDVAVKKVIR